MEIALALMLLAALLAGGEALAAGTAHRRLKRLGLLADPSHRTREREAARPVGVLENRTTIVVAVGLAAAMGFAGLKLAGPVGLTAGLVGGAILPVRREGRRARRRDQLLEQQLADLTESMALGVRSGLSVSQALEFVASEMENPMAELTSRLMAEQRLGTPFEVALEHLGEALATGDARLFVLVVTIHSRSGGNMAGALDEVTRTIRHRLAVRRELRALSAQGRMSAVILASLPIAFSLILTAASGDELVPVYHSAMGQAMLAIGLAMEAAAFVWMRRVLRIHV
ncbi:MAG: type II secretion system F family protein [Actinomycetota bacterium]